MDRAELSAFLDTDVAMLGASADEHLLPEVFRVWGAWLDEAGQLRALVSSDAGRTLASLRVGSRLCFTFTDITTFRSVQVKGSATAPAAPPGPAEIVRLRQYDELFAAVLLEVGHPPQLCETLRPRAVFAVAVDIDDLYDQTPGPSAGAHLTGVLT